MRPAGRGHEGEDHLPSVQSSEDQARRESLAIQEVAMKSALRLAMLLSLIYAPARAHEVETGPILVCDTQKQVERYVQLFDGNPQVAISSVNAEANDQNACAMVDVAYVQGPPLELARSKSHAFRVVPIVVVGMNRPTGFQRLQPVLVFTLVKVKEFAV
jgi:hypothetical protein